MSSVERMRIGWIGAGRMGAAMVRRLLEAGHEVEVFNRTRAKAEALVPAGATVAASPADLAGRDVVFTMVSGPADLEAVVCGDGGLLDDAEGRAPRVLVDASTVSVAASARVRAAAAARGAAFLAAPVSGNPRVVESGRLTFVASGPRWAYDAVLPLLDEIGRGATFAGEGEVARLVKLAHNVVLGITAQALAETTALVESQGVSRRAYLSFLNDSVMGSTFTKYKTPALVNLDWTPTLTPDLMRKDLDLALAVAADAGVCLPLAGGVRARVQAMLDAGFDDVDFQALLLLQAEEAALVLVPDPAHVDDGLPGAVVA
ncbi:2-hydroxy-3-oxopropionate reductase [Baekduia alba]|uniref:NAD(P)-dependent oxidoreductase n=1 Tax=Baekduia alba TaxID=2997333 RepID=UPI002340DFED|nr:NAD(P)-dependent oxidoreductase [Baekduia alba]WCB91738.1 2-hydroxy-3-oxopropionate reductase [Baekduia alba]